MKRRDILLTAVVIVGLLAYFLWSSFTERVFQCEVCVEYNGQKNCAVASAATEAAARHAAQATACGTLAKGRLELEKCANKPPLSAACRKL